ncbi:MAG: DUF2911 domain-containing protein [Gemmatimonadaceae bacterium]|nr:DUF2911 domain-containing protein [Gemmatimonadaceae bacterium]NUQ93915.1 DUF2911 domain-containing protein [Gemmatimonadaceae bacterium]NUR21152.1 DUF2911 domain-containing protein [Gemmatimonadaceae bacterium]NUS97999.1 DUF2911 domain-containing protein [Gemmatimonadaceae bacterium]
MKLRLIALAIALPVAAHAQAPSTPAAALPQTDPSKYAVALSTRARAEVSLAMPRVAGQPASPTLKISIDYGQPHARGRAVLGGLIPFDTVWRTGANSSTTLTTDADLTIGGTFVPKGSYSLYTLASRAGAKLIINKQTGQWGTVYDPKLDLARIDLATRTLSEPAESFTITLVPADPAKEPGPAHGRLVLAWGTTEMSTAWKVGR